MLRTKREYIEDCARKVDHLRARKLATEAELGEYRPASKGSAKEAWVFWWGQLVGYCRRQESREFGFAHEEADAQALQALNGMPASVVLRAGRGESPALVVEVHPKGFEALWLFFHHRDWLLKHLSARVDSILQDGQMSDFELLERASAELTYQTQLLAYAACSSGPGLPFAWDSTDITVPDPYSALLATDLLRINEAFMQVNAGQLQALERLIAPTKPGSPTQRPAWSIFFGQLEMRLQVSAESLMRDRPLAQLLATVKLAAPASAEEELEGAMA